ncbi:hypothetical protein [Micromonospora echinofusca]|uniref:DNA-binding transcriptional activator of the SARP family n=1 Tax=Micromonospora echinofusca TaxID=47858 RepID=A0A1C5G6T0_MICEH|nr:hypothetical protein [Micromonospora echinofusca]SCG15440.1 hypothetical protein GA0070610_1671 [Micromonospora echinofusca]
MELLIRLLGCVELCVDGQVVTPGAARRRAVLAGLALEANRPVPLSRLADMVWSDVPPASAAANLRSHAAGLRRAPGDRLVARPNAYELRLSPDELDVTEFHWLAGEGRALLVLVGQLADGRERLDLLDYEDLSVRGSLTTAVAAVRADDEVAGRILALLGAAPDALRQPERVARQLGISAARLDRALDDLADAHLLQPYSNEPGRHLLPALVREYAAELAAEPRPAAGALTGRRVDPLVA